MKPARTGFDFQVRHGVYSVTDSTSACGALSEGSTPSRHPTGCRLMDKPRGYDPLIASSNLAIRTHGSVSPRPSKPEQGNGCRCGFDPHLAHV